MNPVCGGLVSVIPIAYGLQEFAHTAEIYCCLMIAVDRAVAFLFPLKSGICQSMKNSLLGLTFVAVWASLFSSPAFFELKVGANGLYPTALRSSYFYQIYYRNGAKLALKLFVPFLLLIVCNSIILFR